MDRSPRFGSISRDNCPMKTRFCYGSAFRLLRLAARHLYCSPTTPFSRFRLLPFCSPLLWESLLLSFPLATKMFQFSRLSLACPWIQQQFERLPYSGIPESMLIFNSPKHFVDYYALPRLWVPMYPPSRVGDKQTRAADIRRRANHHLSGPPTDSTIEANDRQ
ncbi:hypothetical protein R3W88_024239 [Solanum pinnatisectum]|uniref:Uncharacterized protein n=1 Tax=Solanum pinnatisectum TaxID=50273 RepID=A0AAV9LZU7_9SOLN|nr:hypothetical protein R3W88_024239 [Solanum pinnatisectum]